MSHFNALPAAFLAEWNARPDNTHLTPEMELLNDGTRYWWIEDANGQTVINWECRNFPGCASLVITTKVELRENLRGRGLGRYFRELRHRAYRRAGFVGEIATVRSDNAQQNRLMETMNGVRMGTFPSDFGGSYSLWLTNLQAPQPAVQPAPLRAEYQAFVAPPNVGTAEAAFQTPLRAQVMVPVVTMPRGRTKTHAHRRGQ